MRPKTIVIVLGLVFVLVIAGYSYTTMGDKYFEEETQFGSWGQQVLINYADGSQESLSIISTNPVRQFAITHGGTAVTSITYRLSAKATGSGYTTVGINYTSYSIKLTIGTNTVTKTFTGSPASIPIDSVWHLILSTDITASEIQDSLSAGTYTMTVAGQGTIKYRGDTSVWQTAGIPTALTFEMVITPENSLTTDLAHEVIFSGVNTGSEDLTTYSIVNTGGYFSVSSSSILVSNYPQSDSVNYLRKAKPIGTGAFTLSFNVIATRMDNNPTADSTGGQLCFVLCKNLTTINRAISKTNLDGILWTWRSYTNGTGVPFLLMQCCSRSAGSIYSEHPCSLNTLYAVKISRASTGTITYTIATGGTTIHTGTLAGDTCNIQYFLPICGGSTGTNTVQASGTLSNFVFS